MNRADVLKLLDATAGALACRLAGRFVRADGPDSATSPPSPATVTRILVIRPGGLGDMVVLLPVLALLRRTFPGAALDIVCETRNLGVLRLAGLADSALPYDSHPLQLLRRLRRRHYDAAIDTEQFHHFSAVLAYLSGAPFRIGFKINPLRNPLYTHLVNYAPDGAEGVQFLRLLAPLGIAPPAYVLNRALAGLALPLPPTVAAHADALQSAEAFAVVHPGSSTPYKQWPPERFAAVAAELHLRYGLAVALVGGAEDRRQAEAIRTRLLAAGIPAASFVGEIGLEGTAALMKTARIFVGTDSGLSHLAVALGLRTVVLFGPSDRLKWGTEDDTHATVRKDMPCAPCFIFGYHKPCRTRQCMQQIAVADVLEACRRVLAAAGTAAA